MAMAVAQIRSLDAYRRTASDLTVELSVAVLAFCGCKRAILEVRDGRRSDAG